MRLIGMLDSPYVRRVAISFEFLGVPFQHDMRAVSLALAACEKSVQIVYERNLRPAAAQHEPWVERVTGQVLAAYGALEQEVQQRSEAFRNPRSQASITAAVAWQFTQSMIASVVPASSHPELVRHSARMEQTPQFLRYPPDGPDVPTAI